MNYFCTADYTLIHRRNVGVNRQCLAIHEKEQRAVCANGTMHVSFVVRHGVCKGAGHWSVEAPVSA